MKTNSNLGSVVQWMKTGKTPPSANSEYFDGDIPWYTPGDLDRGKYLGTSKRTITEIACCDRKVNLLPAGCLLVTCIGEIAKLGISKTECSSNQQITAFLPKPAVSVDYLYYWFIRNRVPLQSMANNAVVPIINNGTLAKIEFCYPSLPEQERIAALLDKADALRQQHRALIAQYQQLAQSLFLEMFGDPVRNEKGWEVRTLGEVVENENNFRVPLKQSDRLAISGSFPYYGASGIIDWVNDFTHEGMRLLIGEDGANLLSRNSPIAFIASGKFWVNNHAHVLAENGQASIRFVEHFVNQIDLEPYVTGSAQPKLTRGNLDEIPIPLPPLPLQQKFAAMIENIELQKQVAEADLSESEALFQRLLQDCFGG